jgi:hypothetical protein
MKVIIYLIIIVILLRWITQAFKSNVTFININQQPRQPKEGNVTISGNVKTRSDKDDLGKYVDYEEVKD